MSMIDPPINEMLRIINCKYSLAVAAAKRSRQIITKAPILTDFQSHKPVTIAVHEIYEGKVKINSPVHIEPRTK